VRVATEKLAESFYPLVAYSKCCTELQGVYIELAKLRHHGRSIFTQKCIVGTRYGTSTAGYPHPSPHLASFHLRG